MTIPNAVYTPDGKVVVRYDQPMPKAVKIGNKTIVFDSKFGVSLAFVDEEDVPAMLSFLGGCCGGKKQVITLASEVAYSHWQNGQGGR